MVIYYIVKLDNVETRVDRYIFVPESSVKIRRPVDDVAVIVLPDDQDTEELIKINAKPEADWRQYSCQIVDSKADFCEAMIAAMQFNHYDPKPATPTAPKTQKRKPIDLTADLSPNKTKRETSKSIIEHASPQTISKFTNTKPDNQLFTQLSNFLCQLQKNTTEMLNIMNDYNTLKPNLPARPAEYRENDTTWTLKHPHPGPGLVELISNSNIYVHKNQLDRYTTMAIGINPLIRTLMTLIFKQEALSFCTLSQNKNELDVKAVNDLLDYVKVVARHKGWPPVDVIAFNDSVRQKLKDTKRNALSNSL